MNKEKLGTENIGKLLASLAIPAVVAQIVNLLYNIVDRVYIGHIPGIGAAALTGVGLFTPILMMINAFAMFAGSGGAPKASIFFGAKENEKAEKVIGNCFSFSLIVAVILTVIFYVFAPQLLTLFGASEATLPYALSYARIYVLGTVVVYIGSILRFIGQTRTLLYAEAVLLVRHRQRQIGKAHILLQKCMRTHDHINKAQLQIQQQLTPCLGTHTADYTAGENQFQYT